MTSCHRVLDRADLSPLTAPAGRRPVSEGRSPRVSEPKPSSPAAEAVILRGMSRSPIPTWTFALVAVRREDQFLLVQEDKKEKPWYLPAGRVEAGESLVDGAVRETMEEAGVPVAIDGVVRIEHTPASKDNSRLRVFFTGHAIDDRPPKSVPRKDTLRAAWFTLDEIRQLKLRNTEALEICEYLAAGGPVYPIALLAPKGSAPFAAATADQPG